jgi:hypothetical protein
MVSTPGLDPGQGQVPVPEKSNMYQKLKYVIIVIINVIYVEYVNILSD